MMANRVAGDGHPYNESQVLNSLAGCRGGVLLTLDISARLSLVRLVLLTIISIRPRSGYVGGIGTRADGKGPGDVGNISEREAKRWAVGCQATLYFAAVLIIEGVGLVT